jgi:hypothetical protein
MTRISNFTILAAFCLFVSPSLSMAEIIFKCTDANGRLSLSDRPCGGESELYAIKQSAAQGSWTTANPEVTVSQPPVNEGYYQTIRNNLNAEIEYLENSIAELEQKRRKITEGGRDEQIKKAELELRRLQEERNKLDQKEAAEKARPITVKSANPEEGLAGYRYQHKKDNYRLPRERLQKQISDIEEAIRIHEHDKIKKKKEYDEKARRAVGDNDKLRAVWREAAAVQAGLDEKVALSYRMLSKVRTELRELNAREREDR